MRASWRSGGGASVTYGGYRTDYTGFYGGGQDLKDGEALTVAGWQGFGLGSDGFLTASVEYRDRERTNRSDLDPRFNPSQVRGAQGDPESEDLAVYLNAGKPLAAGWEAYGWVGYQTRDASAASAKSAAATAVRRRVLLTRSPCQSTVGMRPTAKSWRLPACTSNS